MHRASSISHHPLTIKQSILHKQLLLLFESQDKVSDSPKFSCLSADYCHLTILLSPDRVTSLSGRGAGECDVRLVCQVQDKVPRQVRSLTRVSRALINPPLLIILLLIITFFRNNCTYCGGDLEDNYPPAALCLAIVLFPVGILGCLLLKERQCVLCNRTSSA